MASTTTFADLIERHGREVAFLAAVHDENATPADPQTMTDADFVALVHSAAQNLELFRMQDWGEGFDSALPYLNDALETDDTAEKAVLLKRANRHLKDSYDVASELACNVGIDFPA